MSSSHPAPPAEALEFSRRGFLASSTALALCLAGCRSWTANTRAAHALVTDPPSDAYRPVLMGLVGAVLPFEHPEFPALSPVIVGERLLRLFPVDRESRFLTLQRGLVMFDQVELFPHAFPPIVAAEDLEPEGSPAIADWIERGARADERRYAAFMAEWRPERPLFSQLRVAARRAYLTMWMRSSFVVRRQFARSAKSMVTIAAYSMDALWKPIGYRGPLIEGTRAPT